MAAVTITLSGSTSNLSAKFFPPIELDSRYEYECGLIDFQSFYSIPNIDIYMNEIRIGNSAVVIPTGIYEIETINEYIQKQFQGQEVSFNLKANKNTLRSELCCSHIIDFTGANTIAPMLGFSKRKLEPNQLHISDNLVNIFSVNIVRIECDLIKGSYLNEKKTHTLHEFFPKVAPGYKIIESPRNVIYFPLTKTTIDSINLTILDQDNNSLNFRGENITIRIHIKKIQ